jgi:signal recognition particle GTPase
VKKTFRPLNQKQQEKRQAKLDEMDEQIKDGSLVIRKMTAKERKDNPPLNRARKKRFY